MCYIELHLLTSVTGFKVIAVPGIWVSGKTREMFYGRIFLDRSRREWCILCTG